jgi:hypothetical protein
MKKQSMEYKKKCNIIMSFSKSIRYVGVINEYGKTLTGILKPGIRPLFSKKNTRDEFFAISSFMKLRNKSALSIGELNYVMLNHQKILSLIFQYGKIIYYVTFENKSMPTKLLIRKIKKVIMQE